MVKCANGGETKPVYCLKSCIAPVVLVPFMFDFVSQFSPVCRKYPSLWVQHNTQIMLIFSPYSIDISGSKQFDRWVKNDHCRQCNTVSMYCSSSLKE